VRDKYELAKLASVLRARLGTDDRSPIDVFSLAYSIERLTLVLYPMGEHISGMCIKYPSDVLIAINSSMSEGRQRFSLAHELYHCYFDDTDTVLCAKSIGTSSDIEKEADIFASYFLAPPAALVESIEKVKGERELLDLGCVIRLEQYFRMSRQAMLFRLVEEGELLPSKANPMRSQVIPGALALGYDDTLYRPTPEERGQKTYGRYIKQAEALLKNGLISDGKYEELLLEAFRADIVYGLDDGCDKVD
jgi:Zn-dependent peptidase ImmA (M78 family)